MKNNDYNPTPIRLKEIKADLQKEAMRQDRSLNWLIVKVLKDFLKGVKK